MREAARIEDEGTGGERERSADKEEAELQTARKATRDEGSESIHLPSSRVCHESWTARAD